MKVYLVGGAVRDALLGVATRDRDYVVTGSTPEAMVAAGFQPVGQAFPIFLHPGDKSEYALARLDRQAWDPAATIESDLACRDLTINAMAQDLDTGAIVDPFGGQQDLAAGLLRHVPGFSDDPIRVIRTARLAARLGFAIAPETQALMRELSENGALAAVHPTRQWQDLAKALVAPHPDRFLRHLHDCGALQATLPEVEALYGVPQHAQWHPEVDTGVHTEMVLGMAARLAPGDLTVAWAALTHDLGKALTPKDLLPAHHGHEEGGLAPLAAVHARLPVPTSCQRLAEQVCKHHLKAHTCFESKASTLLKLFIHLGGIQQPERVRQFVAACESDKRGRGGMTETAYAQGPFLLDCLAAARSVRAQDFLDAGYEAGPALGERVYNAQITAIKRVQQARKQALAAGSDPAVTPLALPVKPAARRPRP